MKTFLLPSHHSTPPQAPRRLAIVFAALIALTFATPGLRAATDVLFADNFQPVQAEGWNGMSWDFGAATGVVPTTQFPPGNYSYLLYAYGGGASGWAVYNTPILAGLSEWSYQAKAKYDQSLLNGTPQPGYYGSGGLLISATGDMSGDFIWVGLDCNFGEYDPAAGVTFARPMLEYRLGGETGKRTLYPPEVDSWDAVRMSKGNALGPATLTASRTAGSPGTITFVVDSPVDGPRTATINFTGAAATALDNLKYVGFVNYFSQWEYDDVSVTDGSSEIYANDFENGGQPGWNTLGNGFWWVRGGPGGTNGLFTFRDQAIADGYAFYTAPVLTNTSTNWSYSGQAKWTGSTGVNPWYGVGGLVLSSDQYGSDYLWVGYTRYEYVKPTNVPPIFSSLRLSATESLAGLTNGLGSSYNPVIRGSENFVTSLQGVNNAVGRFASGSGTLAAGAANPINNSNDARMIQPFRGANSTNYILGATTTGTASVGWTRYDYNTLSNVQSVANPFGSTLGSEGWDWVDDDTVITTFRGSGWANRLGLIDITPGDGTPGSFAVRINTNWNSSGYASTGVSNRIRNVQVGETYTGFAYYGNNASTNNTQLYAIDLATGVSTLLGDIGTITTNASGTFGLWTVKEVGGYLYVSTTDNGIFVYPMTGPTSIGALYTNYTAADLASLTGGNFSYFGFDIAPDGSRILLGSGGPTYELSAEGSAWCYPFYEYRLDGVTGTGNFTAQGAFRDFPDSPPVGITLSREPGSNELTFVVETPLDGVQTNTITLTGDAAAMLDSLQYVGLRNYFGAFQYGNLQVTTTNFVPPTITSTNAFFGTVGAAFSNNITATGDEPIVFSGAGLPAGLTVATNGLISGTPTAAGTFSNVVFTAAGASFSQNFESYAAGSYPFPSNPLPGWAALPSAYGLTPSIVTNTAGNGKALEMPSAGGGATGWMLVSSNVLAGPSDEWQVSATSKWTATFNPSIPYYGSGGVLVSDTLPSETLTGNWLQIGYARGEYGDTNDPTRSWSLPILEGSLGGTPVSVPLGGPAFRDFPEHAPIGLTVTRRAGTITLTISTPLDGTMVRSHTFTGDQAAALDTLQYAGFANYYSDWEYDNLQVANSTALDSQIVTFTIAKGTPTITLAPTASPITAGQALSASLLTGGTASIPGTFDWTTPSTVPPSTGLYGVTFSPTDAANYNTATTDVSVTVNSSSAYNTWAGGYGLDPSVSSGPTAGAPTADPDGDNFDNAAEYAFGTNPTVGNGALLGTSTSGGNVLISWLEVSGGGVTYAVEETSNLAAGPWTLSSVIPTATGAPAPAGYAWKQISVPAGPGKKFYRVEASY